MGKYIETPYIKKKMIICCKFNIGAFAVLRPNAYKKESVV